MISHSPQHEPGFFAAAHDPSRARRIAVVAAILLLAFGLRLWGALEDLPFSYNGDESHFIKRAMAMGTGDLNPHWFHKPAFLMYLLLGCFGLYYVAGYAGGAFDSVDQFGASFLNDIGPFVLIGRLLVVLMGTATVLVVYLAARRAFRGFHAGVAAALAAAVLFPMVAGSQIVKADVPAGLFVALSFLAYLRSRDTGRLRDLALAALLAGVAMGTKYYGVILVPCYLAAEAWRRFGDRLPWGATLKRVVLVGVVFTLGFFVVSPYNFIDPIFRNAVLERLHIASGLAPDAGPQFDPDTMVEYDPGLSAIPGATAHYLGRLADAKSLGLGLALLAALGLAAGLAERRYREATLLAALPIGVFTFMSVTFSAYHINWRHFNAILPLLCLLLVPGALAVVQRVPLPPVRRPVAAIALVALLSVPTLVTVVRHDLASMKPDTRTAAWRWIVDNVPAEDRMLVDEYGPELQHGPGAVERQRRRLEGLPAGEAFTRHQGQRLDLLARHPGPAAKNLDELSHPWWSNRELTDEELRSDWKHRDMGSPHKLRVPRSLEDYRAEGYRWIVTNSKAQQRYFESEQSREAFPSFVRFYEELRELEPFRVFDPRESGGKGPVILIYRLEPADPASRASDATELTTGAWTAGGERPASR